MATVGQLLNWLTQATTGDGVRRDGRFAELALLPAELDNNQRWTGQGELPPNECGG
jgi:hypothetical protein